MSHRVITRPPRVQAIIEQVSALHGIPVDDICNKYAQDIDVRRARFAFWHRVRNEIQFRGLPPSYGQIGKWTGGQDHTTVLKGLKRHCIADCQPRFHEPVPDAQWFGNIRPVSPEVAKDCLRRFAAMMDMGGEVAA